MSQVASEMTEAAEGDSAVNTNNKVLIVDDYLVDRRIAGAIVEKFSGLQPIYASDGREALEMIARELPAAVLSDLQMPGMDGLALVQEIRERFPRLPVILMTAHGSENVAILALRAGATNYVPKKSLARELGETLRQVIALSAVDRHRQRVLESLSCRHSRFILENDPSLITPMINLLQEDLGGMGICDATGRMRVGVAIQEALANALYHGNLEVDSDLRQDDEREFYSLANRRRTMEPYQNRKILIDSKLDRDSAVYIIEDEGPGFDISSLDKPIDPEDLMRIGGRGMLLIRTFMDEVTHNAAGNQITMIKHRKSNA